MIDFIDRVVNREDDYTEEYEVQSRAEVEFVEKNPELKEVLSLVKFLSRMMFGPNISSLKLELFEEGEDWKTLFVTGEAASSPEIIDHFFNLVFDFLYHRYPESSSKFNLDIRPKAQRANEF